MKKRIFIFLLCVPLMLGLLTGCLDVDTEDEKEEKNEKGEIVFESENFSISDKELSYIYSSIYQQYYYQGLAYGGESIAQYVAQNATTPEKITKYTKGILMLCEEAKGRGVELTADDLAKIDADFKELKKTVKDSGRTLAELYGSEITEKDIKNVMKLEALCDKMQEKKLEELEEILKNDTDKLKKFVEENGDMFVGGVAALDTEKVKNVAHILIKSADDTAASDNIASNEAYAVLTQLGSNPTREEFIDLAEEKTDDSGIVYENVFRGQMVKEFNDWVYDLNRKVGDTGIVKTSYGYHVMYFIGEGEITNWEYMALYGNGISGGLIDQEYSNWESGLTHTVTVDDKALAEIIPEKDSTVDVSEGVK